MGDIADINEDQQDKTEKRCGLPKVSAWADFVDEVMGQKTIEKGKPNIKGGNLAFVEGGE